MVWSYDSHTKLSAQIDDRFRPYNLKSICPCPIHFNREWFCVLLILFECMIKLHCKISLLVRSANASLYRCWCCCRRCCCIAFALPQILSVCIYVYLSLSLSLSRSRSSPFCLPRFLCVCECVFVCVSMCVCVCIYVCVCVSECV